MKDINTAFIDAISKTFKGHFSKMKFLNGSSFYLLDDNENEVALLSFNGNILTQSVFYNEQIFNECLPAIMYTPSENKLLKKAFMAFCSNDALVHMIKTKGEFNLKTIYQQKTTSNPNVRKEYTFYNACTLSEIELLHSPIRHHFYYSYDKKMILGKDGLFHPVLFLTMSLKQKNYSILLSPELNKTANKSTFTGDGSRNSLYFEEFFENGLKIRDLKYAVEADWSYDIFFYYIDCVLKDRPLVDSIFNSCSNYEDIMNLVEMHII